jgi:hypothetical protein
MRHGIPNHWDEALSHVGREREPLGRGAAAGETPARTIGTKSRPKRDAGANYWYVRLSHVGREREPLGCGAVPRGTGGRTIAEIRLRARRAPLTRR